MITVDIFFVILGARLSSTISFLGPLMHLCDLEAGYGEMGSKVCGAAPGFEPGTSCMRVRSRNHYATGAAPMISYILLNYMDQIEGTWSLSPPPPPLFECKQVHKKLKG